ncbi:MAG: OmpA family protein [Alphaproteobacteria bacterium]|nr:OmpA family protein [Alphaproteobacteria bacterium]
MVGEGGSVVSACQKICKRKSNEKKGMAVNIIRTSAITLVAAVTLSACVGTQLEKAKMAEGAKTPFNFNLVDGYIGLASMEYKEGDYEDSDRFASRAMAAAAAKKDTKVKPEGFKKRGIPADKIDDMRRARGKLMIALAQGGRENFPRFAAETQVNFDCWMQEQEENFQPKDIAACKKKFDKSLAKLQKMMAPKPKAKKKMAMAKPMMAAKPRAPEPPDVDGIYIIFFDFNSSKLTTTSQRTLRKAAAEFALIDSPGMSITGHADMSGNAKYNEALSRRRLDAVSSFLLDMKVPRGALHTSAHGESKPLVPTKDGKREKRNRRVEIIFE